MVEINDWLWEGLYTMKRLYNHGKVSALLSEYGACTLDGDLIGGIAMSAIYEVFEKTLDYWDDRCDQDIYVFFDPILSEFYRLCCEYEKRQGIAPSQNPHKEDIRRAIRSGLNFDDYSYDYWYYEGSQRDGKSKIILKLYPDFCHIYEVAGGLLDVYDAFAKHVEILREELGITDGQKIIELPPVEEKEEKEAA